ncbi:MAG: glycosyltransferase family 9 protein [Planctomycetota bacterium]
MNLVFHQAALGDFALILPLLRGLDGPTTLVAPWSRGRLASALIDNVSAMDIELFEFSRLHSDDGPHTLSPAVKELFDAAEAVISFVAEESDPWAEHVVRLAPQCNLVCLDTRPAPESPGSSHAHITEWHRERLLSFGIAVNEVDIKPTGDPNGPIVIHPGSGGRDKCWPRDRFESLIEACREKNHPVRVIFGEAEAARWPQHVLERWHDRYHAVGCGSLELLVEQLMGASAYVGNDAGPTQLAAQLGLPTTALFGPTDPSVWAPRGPSVRVIAPPEAAEMEWLSVDHVVSEVLG